MGMYAAGVSRVKEERIPILLQYDSAHLTRFWASLSLSERVAKQRERTSEGLGAGLGLSRGFPFSLFSLAPFAFSDSPCSVKRSACSVQRSAGGEAAQSGPACQR